MDGCIRCGSTLEQNDIGAYKKFINRESREYMCIRCLSTELGISETLMREKIAFFKKQGCTLFV